MNPGGVFVLGFDIDLGFNNKKFHLVQRCALKLSNVVDDQNFCENAPIFYSTLEKLCLLNQAVTCFCFCRYYCTI